MPKHGGCYHNVYDEIWCTMAEKPSKSISYSWKSNEEGWLLQENERSCQGLGQYAFLRRYSNKEGNLQEFGEFVLPTTWGETHIYQQAHILKIHWSKWNIQEDDEDRIAKGRTFEKNEWFTVKSGCSKHRVVKIK